MRYEVAGDDGSAARGALPAIDGLAAGRGEAGRRER